ncbi:DNA-processing protein DprA [Bacillus sp. FJAT-29814]|uniref:DNA-processing protein DprA n=1 Tax=Bacillus sp. FJAT-29814 TaxID=1729688 RepID=UPI000834BF02|nr:DNA-processing protein DprA [Bacillus sp. FJAT-29814]
MNKHITEDSYAILLLCSALGLKGENTSNKSHEKYKPFSQKEWLNLTQRIIKSGLERPSALFKLTAGEIRDYLYLPEETANRISYLLNRTTSLTMELEKLSNMGIWVTTRAESNYPTKYKKRLKADSPTILYGSGDISLVGTDGIGIVGSRDVDEPGQIFTSKLAKKCAEENLTVISGGSRGVDMIAQETALQSHGKVIAVLSDSLSKTIQNREIRDAVISGNLLLLSAFHPNSRFTSYNALGRNKHIYGLSKYTLISSSDFNKGGTWKGAIENLKSGWVPAFVRTGDAVPVGNQELIKRGVIAITESELTSENVSLEHILKNKLSATEDNTINNLSKLTSKDIFFTVWPIIEESLVKPKTEKELAELYQVEQNQMNIWLKKAVSLKKIKYLNDTHFISSVFYNKEDEATQLDIFNIDR